jgi:hypothetical protein
MLKKLHQSVLVGYVFGGVILLGKPGRWPRVAAHRVRAIVLFGKAPNIVSIKEISLSTFPKERLLAGSAFP